MNRPKKRARAAMNRPKKRGKRTIQSKKPARNWLDLPPELLSVILTKLNAVEILTSVQHVCSSWYKICKHPHMWRKIDMHNLFFFRDRDKEFERMCMNAVHRSRGQVVDIAIDFCGTNDLLQYIVRKSNQQLRRLSITGCNDISEEGLAETVSKLPLLENLEILLCSLKVKTLKSLKIVGQCCPLLRTLKLYKNFWKGVEGGCDMEALDIAETMPKLRHLMIIGNSLTDGLAGHS